MLFAESIAVAVVMLVLVALSFFICAGMFLTFFPIWLQAFLSRFHVAACHWVM